MTFHASGMFSLSIAPTDLLRTQVTAADAPEPVVPSHTLVPSVPQLSSSFDIHHIILNDYVLHSTLRPIINVDGALRHIAELCGVYIISVRGAVPTGSTSRAAISTPCQGWNGVLPPLVLLLSTP